MNEKERFARFRFLTTGPILEHLQRVEGQCITLLLLFMFCFSFFVVLFYVHLVRICRLDYYASLWNEVLSFGN